MKMVSFFFFVSVVSLFLLNEVGSVAFQSAMIQVGPIKICSYSNCKSY